MDIPQDCISISEFHDIRDLIYVIKVKDADDPTTSNGRVIIRITSGNELGAINFLISLDEILCSTMHDAMYKYIILKFMKF